MHGHPVRCTIGRWLLVEVEVAKVVGSIDLMVI